MAIKDGLYEKAVQALLDLLNENSSWSVRRLTENAAERSGWKSMSGITMAVKVLDMAGHCKLSTNGRYVERVTRAPASTSAEQAQTQLDKIAAAPPRSTTLELKISGPNGKSKNIKGV